MWLSGDLDSPPAGGDTGAVCRSIVVPGKPNMGARWVLMSAGKLSAGFDGDLLDPIARLLRLLDRPEDIPVLAPTIEREILWRL